MTYIHTYSAYINNMFYTIIFDVSVMEKSDRPVDYGRLTVNISGKETSDFEKLEDGLSSTDLSMPGFYEHSHLVYVCILLVSW
jgi:hypothetical protein